MTCNELQSICSLTIRFLLYGLRQYTSDSHDSLPVSNVPVQDAEGKLTISSQDIMNHRKCGDDDHGDHLGECKVSLNENPASNKNVEEISGSRVVYF